MAIKPLADHILLKLEKPEEKTASGILLPGTAQEETSTGRVVAVGPGTDKEKISVKAGDMVMFYKDTGVKVKSNGEEFLILRNGALMAVLD
ncbi:MAG: co-chaperone GroES [Treponema sp.]|nr:co-chaperone GroES [Candidatus Treponema equifaecale]